MQKGKLIILSGQSGVGKSTIAQSLLINNSNLYKVITCTTREPRPGEVEGIDYYFIKAEEFEEKIKRNYFLEHAKVHNWYYGTPVDQVNKALDKGNNVLMIIDVQGAMQVKEKVSDAILIFIQFDPGNLEKTIRHRFENDPSRKTINEDEIIRRIESAEKEASYATKYDFIVTNSEGQLEKAISEVNQIIQNNCK